MNGGSQIVGLWRDQVASGDQFIEQPAASEPEGTPMIEPPPGDDTASYDEEAGTPAGGSWIAPALFLLLALGWIGFVGWTVFASGGARLPAEAMTLVAVVSPPLALLGVAWLLLMRTSRSEARRFGATAAMMRAESAALEARVAALAARLDDNRQALAAQADQLLSLGEDTTHRMAGVASAMRGEGETIERNAHTLQNSVTAARADMAVLLSSLPKAQVQTRQMVASIQEAGMGALEQAGALEAQLSSLIARGREADEVASGAAQRLAAHLGRMEGTSETAGARLEEAAGQMTGAVDAALARASEAVDEARKGMEAQGAAMLALVEQSKAVLERTGADTADDLSKRVAEINGQVEALGSTLAAHDITGRALIAKLAEGLAEVDARLAALDQEGGARAERLGGAISTLTDHADRLSAALDGNGVIAETLIGRAETLLTALDASAREIDETLPASLARLDIVTAASRSRLQALAPELGTVESTAAAALDRLAQTEKLLIQQREAIDQLDAAASAQLDSGRKGIDELAAALGAVDLQARALADGSGTQLIEVMLRVRDTASQAAERAREALGKVIPEAAESLGQASAEALREAIGDPIEQQMASLTAAAERAVESANKASDRLMREMLTISETTSAIESRFEESRSEAEEANRETFARRVSLLIESLNSTAIDVTKILSNEVTDSAWAAYLKGDRGVFTRRAVRLLDTGESREILRQYDEDPEFREQVNRYIHDFEAMLRNVLATREGSPLGVTLLSSDMGKLYVALAQAIERLRG